MFEPSAQKLINVANESITNEDEKINSKYTMIIAAAKVLRDEGINYQRVMRVTAQDLDWKGVYMSYLQLSLIGCKARVIQGDTLMEPYDKTRTPRDRILLTPAWMGVIV